VLMVHEGGNKAGRFLELAVYAEGGQKWIICLPEGRNGQGWCQFVGELRQMLALHVGKSRSLVIEVPSSPRKQTKVVLGASSSRYPFECSFVEVLRSA
jgi:hypothetical protein